MGPITKEQSDRIEELEAICKPILNLETRELQIDPNYSDEERKDAAEELDVILRAIARGQH